MLALPLGVSVVETLIWIPDPDGAGMFVEKTKYLLVLGEAAS